MARLGTAALDLGLAVAAWPSVGASEAPAAASGVDVLPPDAGAAVPGASVAASDIAAAPATSKAREVIEVG